MNPSEPLLNSDRVAVIDLISRVRFQWQSSHGICIICNEEGETLELTAFVFYPGRNIHGQVCEIRSAWSQQFCRSCINSFFPAGDLTGYS